MTRQPFYEYSTAKTGTSQDLLTIITKAYERHLAQSKTVLPRKTSLQRLVLEAPFVLVGKSVAWLVRMLPAQAALALHDKLFLALSSPHAYRFDPQAPELVAARGLAERLERETGKRPALLALLSHPPVLGELVHMNFELVRHASLALRELRASPCRPRLVAAIDLFALDTAPLWQEGIYAGYISTYHVGLDRLWLNRNVVSGMFLRSSAWYRMALRLLGILAGGREALMVLAGGVPSTTRTLYAAREWVGDARSDSPLKEKPTEVLARLRRLPGFVGFEASGPHGPRMACSAWRMAEAYAMSYLAGVFVQSEAAGRSCADLGQITAQGRDGLLKFLEALGLDEKQAALSLDRLAEELRRETPYRRRFFRVLARRVAADRPVVIVPVVHRLEPTRGIEIGRAWGWRSYRDGKLEVVSSDPAQADAQTRPQDFAVRFVADTFR